MCGEFLILVLELSAPFFQSAMGVCLAVVRTLTTTTICLHELSTG